MMKFPYLLCCLLLLPLQSFSQHLLAKSYQENWNEEEQSWDRNQLSTWTYDQKDREIFQTNWSDSFNEFYNPYNYDSILTEYDDQGNTTLKKIRYWSFLGWLESEYTYHYTSENELLEIVVKSTDAASSDIHYEKSVFERDELENRRSKKVYYALNSTSNWFPNYQRDSFFNDQGCLIKQSIINFQEDGTVSNQRWWSNSYQNDCQLIKRGYWIFDNENNVMYLNAQNLYQYKDQGKTEINQYLKFRKHTNTWDTTLIITNTYDDAHRMLSHLRELLQRTPIDTVLLLYTYRDDGTQITYKEYKTSNFNNVRRSLYQVRVDSTAFYYNDADLLIKKEDFTSYYTNPTVKRTTEYLYYCNGLLKREITGEGSNRKTYEYYGLAECDEEAKNAEILLFPNPSKGRFTLRSELLTTMNAQIQVYSILGQELYSEKVDHIASQKEIQLPDFPAGQYIVRLSNSKQQLSEKIIIH